MSDLVEVKIPKKDYVELSKLDNNTEFILNKMKFIKKGFHRGGIAIKSKNYGIALLAISDNYDKGE